MWNFSIISPKRITWAATKTPFCSSFLLISFWTHRVSWAKSGWPSVAHSGAISTRLLCWILDQNNTAHSTGRWEPSSVNSSEFERWMGSLTRVYGSLHSVVCVGHISLLCDGTWHRQLKRGEYLGPKGSAQDHGSVVETGHVEMDKVQPPIITSFSDVLFQHPIFYFSSTN